MKRSFKIAILTFVISLLTVITVFAKTEPKLSIDMCGLSLRDNVCIKYAVSSDSSASTTLLVWDAPATEYTYGSHTIELESVGTEKKDGISYKIYDYCELSVRDMTKDVYVRAYTRIGDEEYYSDVVKYSILKYAYNKLGKTGTATSDEKLLQLISDMLRYGASAQNYAEYQTDRLPTDSFYEIDVIGGVMADLCNYGLYLEGEHVTFTAMSDDESGESFLYWLDSDGNEVSDSEECTITVGKKNDIYTAVYGEAEDVTMYNVVFKDSDLSVLYTQSVKEGRACTIPNAPEKEGYIFFGWYSDSECQTEFDFNTKITSDITLYAKWVADTFVKKNIYSDSLYKIGFGVTRVDESKARLDAKDSSVTGVRCIIFPVEYGKTYEMHFPDVMQRLIVLSLDSDPRNLSVGESKEGSIIRWVDGQPTSADLTGLLYTPKKDGEFLAIYTGWSENTPVTIYENTILAEYDVPEAWYTPADVGDFLGNTDSFANYSWSSEDIIENLYEPLREIYPEYIKRENIGKDQSGNYDMFCYIFAPENFEQSVFLSAGMHANEEEGYFALAHFLAEVANEDGTNAELHYLREKVRFIVIPVINVWGTHGTHSLSDANWAIRYNSTGTDLNRDFRDKTQKETQNVLSVLDKYGDSISYGIDFHTTPNDNGSDLFFNFPISASNAGVNFKTTNHIYHRMLEEGMISANRPILVPSDSAYGNIAAIDGNYVNPRTLQGVLLSEYNISPITVEYMNFTSGTSYSKGSAEGLSFAVEIFGNFIIQNALFFESK